MSELPPRHAALLRAIDPVELGARLRAARESRGWTQTALADGDISIGYLSRIERGERRPTLKVVATLSRRMGIGIDELLVDERPRVEEEIRLGLDYAELALESGQALDAEHQARQHLARAVEANHAELAERGRFLLARSLEARGDLDEAIIELERLIEQASPLVAVRAGIALSRCYRRVGDVALAVEVGDRLQPRLREDGLAQTDEGVQLAMTVAMAHIEQGNLSRAARICREAVATAEQTTSATARSAAYWNSSIVYSERGELPVAIELAQRALALLGEGRDARNLARLRIELGRLQLNLDPPQVDLALQHLTKGRDELAWSSAATNEVAWGDMLLAQALLHDGQTSEAIDLARSAQAVLGADQPLSWAEATMVLGEGLARLGQVDEAAAAYGEAAAALAGMTEADRLAAQAWYDLADLWSDIGREDEAVQALRGAASASGLRRRSRAAQDTLAL